MSELQSIREYWSDTTVKPVGLVSHIARKDIAALLTAVERLETDNLDLDVRRNQGEDKIKRLEALVEQLRSMLEEARSRRTWLGTQSVMEDMFEALEIHDSEKEERGSRAAGGVNG